MTGVSRDALLAETRRALEVVHPEDAASLLAELEHWIPEAGALAHGRATRPVGEVIDAAVGALATAYPDRGLELGAAILAHATPWRVLAETTLWCEGRTVEELRTVALEPEPPLPDRPGVDWFLWGDDPKRLTQLDGIVRGRRQWMREGQLPQPQIPGGRFLLYWPDEQMSDGASRGPSAGFFDIFDAPPWDTWLHYEPVHHFLVSWVPQPHVERCKAGMGWSEVECHAWLDELVDEGHPRHSLRLAFPPWLRTLAAWR